eukprot:g2946.t1
MKSSQHYVVNVEESEVEEKLKTIGEIRTSKLKRGWDELYDNQKLTAQFIERIMRHIVIRDDMDDKSKLEYERLVTVIRSVFIYVFIAAAVIGTVEGWSFVDSFWWAYITITTIGYGDITPISTTGRILTILYILVGMGYVTAAISTVLAYFHAQSVETTKAKMLRNRIEEEAKTEQRHIDVNTSKSAINRLNTFAREDIGMHYENSTISNLQQTNRFSKYVLYTIILIFVASLFLMLNEDWEFQTSFYFTVVTTLTIGFGDQAIFYKMNGINVTENVALENQCIASKGSCVITTTLNCDGKFDKICNCTVSDKGKVFIILYWLISFASLSNALSSMPDHILKKLCYLCRRCKTKNKINVNDQAAICKLKAAENAPIIRRLPLAFGLYGIVIIYVFVGALIFTALEPENFPDLITAFYFCMVSLTLIGYGDITPRNNSTRIFWIFYVLVGFIFVGMVINNFNNFFALLAKKYQFIWLKILKKAGYKKIVQQEELYKVLTAVVLILISCLLNSIVIPVFECQHEEYDLCGNQQKDCKWNFFTGIYFAIVTMSTLGYGSFYPVTSIGKMWIALFAVFGLSNFAFFLESYIDYQMKKYISLVSMKMKSEDFQTVSITVNFIHHKLFF